MKRHSQLGTLGDIVNASTSAVILRTSGRSCVLASLLLVWAGCQREPPVRLVEQTTPAVDSAAVGEKEQPPGHVAARDTSQSDTVQPAPASDSAQLVLRGQRLFKGKGCVRCHTIGEGYMDGPDLEGVTERRTYARIIMLLTDTENAIQTDPDFQQLRIEHFLDMPNLNLSRAEARSLYFYLRAAPVRQNQPFPDGDSGAD